MIKPPHGRYSRDPTSQKPGTVLSHWLGIVTWGWGLKNCGKNAKIGKHSNKNYLNILPTPWINCLYTPGLQSTRQRIVTRAEKGGGNSAGTQGSRTGEKSSKEFHRQSPHAPRACCPFGIQCCTTSNPWQHSLQATQTASMKHLPFLTWGF